MKHEAEKQPVDVVLEHAETLILNALKSGATNDIHLLETTALELADLNFDPKHQLKLMLDAVRFFYLIGRPVIGLNIADRAQHFAIEIADTNLLSSALSLLGVCAADSGNLPKAMEAYAAGLSLTAREGNDVQECKTWQNLGSALNYSGLFNEAILCFERSIKIAERNPQLSSIIPISYSSIALSCLNLGNISRGLHSIKTSIELANEPIDIHSLQNRVLAENYYTRLLIEIDDFVEAGKHASIARIYASRSKSPRSDITASVAEGLAQVFSGLADIGISRLVQTLERANVLKLAAREVLVAIVKAHEHIGQHDKALVYLKQMLATQRQTQEANVLRHVARHLEQLHTKENSPIEDSKQAIKRLETRQEVLEGRIAKRDLFRQSVEGLERLAVATELRDDSTGEHSYRVGRMSAMLAKEAGFDDDFVFMIDIAGRLHDIGKIAIPDGILLKPSAFNASEREIMEMHTDAGADVLAKSNIPQIKMAEEIARFHHERWDGKGYPQGLAGEAIPLAARITALADVFDALTHVRPYKQAWPIESALTEILSLRGQHFDPELTDIFLGMTSRMLRDGVDFDDVLGAEARKSSFHQAKGKIWDSLKLAKEEYQAKHARTFDLQR